MGCLPSPLDAPHIVASETPQEIAHRLREDEALIDSSRPCSWIAWHLPKYDSPEGKAIAEHFLTDASHLSHTIKSVLHENRIGRIRRYLEDGNGLRNTQSNVSRERKAARERLSSIELAAALKVIVHLQDTAIIQQETPANVITAWLEQQLAPPEDAPSTTNASPDSISSECSEDSSNNIPQPPPIARKQLCYICRLAITTPYPTHPSMCIPCGSFNSASALLSTPQKLALPSSFTALVTGARINLGYHTALRLLRCGAHVIATTRYPRDAVSRYLQESDADEWKDRLRVVGADFRSAQDAFTLVHETKRCLRSWSAAEEHEPKLRLVVNNAAQTLTDSVKKEQRAVQRESLLQGTTGNNLLLAGEGSYTARVRGGMKTSMLLQAPESMANPANVEPASILAIDSLETGNELEPYQKSSWVQSMFEIPYEDLISAFDVNTFVPLILCRELLPLMGEVDRSASALGSTKPEGYIINVSSREGIFEDKTDHCAKNGKHVHTNMSKAALNMLTETEAASAWKARRVAMSTVDPGYMSAAPECENLYGGVRPIGWEDGAGRVLWTMAVREVSGEAVVGRFLKHYGAVSVETNLGRG